MEQGIVDQECKIPRVIDHTNSVLKSGLNFHSHNHSNTPESITAATHSRSKIARASSKLDTTEANFYISKTRLPTPHLQPIQQRPTANYSANPH